MASRLCNLSNIRLITAHDVKQQTHHNIINHMMRDRSLDNFQRTEAQRNNHQIALKRILANNVFAVHDHIIIRGQAEQDLVCMFYGIQRKRTISPKKAKHERKVLFFLFFYFCQSFIKVWLNVQGKSAEVIKQCATQFTTVIT